MSGRKWTRRDVLKTGAAAVGAPLFVPRHVLGGRGQVGANEKVRVAVIGLGGRASGVANDTRAVPGMKIVAVSDCFKPRIGGFIKARSQGEPWQGYEDFRKMIEVEKPDGVMIETTTHARGWITVTAMQMGCHAYIEKPMSLSIAEGRYMVNAARRYKRITQVGTQQRSMPLNNWASDLVQKGAIGKVHTVISGNFVGPKTWPGKPGVAMPKGTSAGWWDTWTSQAEMRPYHPDLQYGWARWEDYDGGGECFGVTGWGTHALDQANRGLGMNETGPVAVWLEEEVKVSDTGRKAKPKRRDDTGVDYHHMARNVVGPRARVRMQFASGVELKLVLDGNEGPGLGAIFVGDKGRIEINRGKIAVEPLDILELPGNPGPPKSRGTPLHVANWIDCVKSGETCTADIEFGQRSTTLCYLVNIARKIGKVGEKLVWDPAAERFTNCPEGNALLDCERRKGWELPAIT